MRIGVIDVGSNTMRLLVAAAARQGAESLLEDRAQVGLAAAIERFGWIPGEKIEEAAAAARGFAQKARAMDCSRVEMVVTAPGRQAVNAEDLIVALQRAAGVPARVLSAQEEGRLAFVGAAAALGRPSGTLAVCDVGGGSTELAVGEPGAASPWVASVDIGSLRLTERCLPGAAPGKRKVERARDEVAALLDGVVAPQRPASAVAVGGSARALRKVVGGELDSEQLACVIASLTGRAAAKVARAHGIGERRAATLLAGAVILEGFARTIDLPMAVVDGGLREGLALEVLAVQAAA
jgi:exopolyphosphatase/guanosine-5'-triphosphate,3'-diphosphate pyrophosphatase